MESSLSREFLFLRDPVQNQNDQLDRFASTSVNDNRYKTKINKDKGLIKVNRTKIINNWPDISHFPAAVM